MANKWVRQEVLEIVIYTVAGILLVSLLPLLAGLILSGFEPEIVGKEAFSIVNYLGKYLIYVPFMAVAFGLIVFPIARLFTMPRGQHPATQDKPRWWTIFSVSLIHSPEENGALYRLFHYLKAENYMRWSLSMVRIFAYSVLIFGVYGLLTISYPQLAIASVPETAQQITAVSDVIFGAAVPSFTENGALLFILFIALGINAYICSRFKLGLMGFFIISYIIICPMIGFAWRNIHNIVYPNSDIRGLATFAFGTIGAALTITFASIIPWLVWHISNNGFIELKKIVTTNADIYFITLLLLVAWTILIIFGEIIAYRIRRNKKEKVVVPT